MTCFLEYFWGHIAWRSTRRGQDVELLFIHDSGESKISDEEICIVFGSSEEEVFGLEISVHYSVIVEVSNRREGGTNKVCGVRLVVGAFTTYAIEKLTTKSEICHKVDWKTSAHLAPIMEVGWTVRLFMVSK